MESRAVQAKFGFDYVADERTYVMGIDQRLAACLAERFRNRSVLETCTGGGFTTIALARVAAHVVTVEIDPVHQAQAKQNVTLAGLFHRVTFVLGDVMADATWRDLARPNAAFLDPDWAVTGPNHIHHFLCSTTRPPADALLDRALQATPNVALVLPPDIDLAELDSLPSHETQRLYLNGSHELNCLYFGELMASPGETEFRV